MMKKYYCPVTNEQFNQLINFGRIFILQCLVVEHSDDSDLAQSKLVDTFIKYLQFKYDEEYLVLEVISDFIKEEKEFQIKIHEVERVFPISEECSKAVIFKHSKIAFSSPIFSIDSLSKINNEFFISDSENGAECLISIFKNIFEDNKVINNEIIQAAFKFRNGHKINKLNAESSIIDFTFLYVYQAYYPLTTLGYFYRTAEILTRKALASKKISYSNEIEKTEIYKLLEELKARKPESDLQKIISFLQTDDRATKFIQNLTSEEVKYFIVIPMFLKIIDEFNDHNQNLEKTSLEKILIHYGSSYKAECQQLVLWIGAYLGYGNCYDYFYLKSNLKFFKSYKPIVSESKSESITNTTVDNSTVDNEQALVTPKDDENISKAVVVSESKTYKGTSETDTTIKDDTEIVNDKSIEIVKIGGVDILPEMDEYQRILLALLNKKGACSLTELTKELKTKQKNDFDKDSVKNILSKMNVEYADKKETKVRLKPPLFDITN